MQKMLPRAGEASLGLDRCYLEVMSLLLGTQHCYPDQVPTKASPPEAKGFRLTSKVGN